MPKINFVCPVCKKKESFDVDPEAIQSSTRNPVPIVITHGTPEHAITIFVDKDYRVRATSVADIVQRIEQMESHSGQFEKKHIPTPKEERVSLSGLDNAQVTIVALADGKKSVEELAHI
ncbi:MAG: hypothetical protein ACFFEV_08035, partial [Candidatus Thorarchaeota archaeon]